MSPTQTNSMNTQTGVFQPINKTSDSFGQLHVHLIRRIVGAVLFSWIMWDVLAMVRLKEALKTLVFLCVFLQCVTEASHQYFESYRRYNYTTPKSYLELIALYKCLLEKKRSELKAARERLENGVEKIAQASAQVSKEVLAIPVYQSFPCRTAHVPTQT